MKKLMPVFSVLFLIVALFVPSMAHAGAPMDRVKTTVDKVITILNNPALKTPAKEKERRAQIRQAVFSVWDFEEMAKRSLAVYWKARTPAEKKEFVALFSDLLERSYINKIESYSGEKIVYEGEVVDDGYATVKSKFVTKRREEITIVYKLLNEKGDWWVYDLVAENVSLVNNYRIQFNKIIRSSSYAELVRKMKNKQESEEFVSPVSSEK